MKRLITALLFSISITSCKELLEPEPVNILSTDIVLSSPDDVENVRIGLYNAFREIAAPKVIAGDFTADMITFRGTYTQYLELGSKQITASNDVAASLWSAIYRTVYVSNFILERLPDLAGVPPSDKRDVLATARFLRGYALFVGTQTYGNIPIPTTTDLEANETIGLSPKEEVLQFILEDYTYALENITPTPINSAFAGRNAVRAALAQYYLYQQGWSEAEAFASQIIKSEAYSLVDFEDVVLKDDSDEFIFKVGYSIADDPGTSATGLNNIFVGRREVIPSNKIVNQLYTSNSRIRRVTIAYDGTKQQGNDNGFSVEKYGTADNDNNDIIIFRLGEIYLIRAEARAHLGKYTGTGSAEEDINALRTRAGAATISGFSLTQLSRLIEEERVYELAFEGHRWYDLKRTGRLNEVMSAFTPNWRDSYNLWPIPLREIQNNPSLANSQNPGY